VLGEEHSDSLMNTCNQALKYQYQDSRATILKAALAQIITLLDCDDIGANQILLELAQSGEFT